MLQWRCNSQCAGVICQQISHVAPDIRVRRIHPSPKRLPRDSGPLAQHLLDSVKCDRQIRWHGKSRSVSSLTAPRGEGRLVAEQSRPFRSGPLPVPGQECPGATKVRNAVTRLPMSSLPHSHSTRWPIAEPAPTRPKAYAASANIITATEAALRPRLQASAASGMGTIFAKQYAPMQKPPQKIAVTFSPPVVPCHNGTEYCQSLPPPPPSSSGGRTSAAS